MTFDAGSIEARLTLKEDDFDKKLTAAEARVSKFEHEQHQVRLTAAFSQGDISRAVRMFADLDNQISRQAASRLRSSPQGSVLGSLNALFSPHAVSGTPTASQAASGGLLGRMTGSNSGGTNRLLPALAIGSLLGGGGGSGSGGHSNISSPGGPGGGSGSTRLSTHIPLTGSSISQTLGGGKISLLTAGVGTALAALPALANLAGVGMGVALIGGLATTLLKQNKEVKSAASSMGKDVMSTLGQTIKPLVPVVLTVFKQIDSLMHQIAPELTGIFKTIAPQIEPIFRNVAAIVKDLVNVMKAAAPAFGPFINALLSIVKNILPPLAAGIKATVPFIGQFAKVLGSLGKDIGSLFSNLGPVIKASMGILSTLLSVVGGLLPIISKLAGQLAVLLGPVIVVILSLFKALEPVILLVGKIFSDLASAVLVNIAGGLKALVGLVLAVVPAFKLLVTAIGQAFTLMENRGILNDLEDAIEKLVPPLAKLITALITGLAPILPIAIKFLNQLAGTLQGALVTAVQVLVPIALQLINDVLKPLIPTIAILLPIVGSLAGALGTGLGAVLQLIAPLLARIAPYVLALVIALKAWAIIQAILNIDLDANPIGLIVIAIAGLIIAATELVKHWGPIWAAVKAAVADAWHFIYDGIGKFLLPLLGPVGLIALGLIELSRHWTQLWGDMKQVANDFAQWIGNDFIGKIIHVFETTIPNIFRSAVSTISRIWGDIENAVKAPVNWVITHVINDGLIHAFDFISSKVGGPHISPIPGLAAGGRIPGYGGGDIYPALLEPGETVVDKNRSRMLAGLFRAVGVPGYSAGGLVNGIPLPSRFSGLPPSTAHIGTGDLSKIGDIGGILAALATGNTTALISDFGKLMGSDIGTAGAVGELAGLLTAVPRTLIRDAIHSIEGFFSSSGGPGGGKFTGKFGAGVAQWRPDVLRVLALLGEPAGLAGQVLFQMQTESGGNPNAINLTDSNAAAGDPSRGLLQTIMSTFMAYNTGPFRGQSIYNPLANIYAAVNYAIHTYGRSLMRNGMGLGSGHGYDSGGWLNPGPTLAFNATGKREAVLTPSQSEAFVAVGEASRKFAAGNGQAAGSGLMRDLYLQLPEGATVAQAMQEVAFRLTVAQQQGFAGVPHG
jgi:hypothetical protein